MFNNCCFYFLDGLFTCGSIHQGLDPELFSDESRGTREIYICLAALFADSRINGGARTRGYRSLKFSFFHGDSFFLCAFSRSDVPLKEIKARVFFQFP